MSLHASDNVQENNQPRVLRSASKESNIQNVGFEKKVQKKVTTSEEDTYIDSGLELEQQISENTKVLTETFQELQELSVPIRVINAPTESLEESSHESQELLTKFKFIQLTAEIEALKNGKSPVVSLPVSSHLDILHSELETSLSQLQETLSFVRAQHREINEEIEREEETNKHLTSVSEALQKRIEYLEENTDNDNSRDKCKKELQEKIDKAEIYMKNVKRKLGNFVGKHFPLPSEEVFNDVKRKLRSADVKMTRDSTITLKKVLEELISKCIDEPNDPYVIIDHRYWPPYVELLLRCQIVLRHPDDEQRIKLVPFHL